MFYYSLSEAINAGLDAAENDLIVVVHEDVYLPEGWQGCLESALEALEKDDPNWGVIGTAGITTAGVSRGHYSDPNNYCNTFKRGQLFDPVTSVDEHLMIIRKSSGLRMDGQHPGIHGIGTDLVLTAQSRDLACYVVNAPSIHKYKTGDGTVINTVDDSPKIIDRANYAYKADKYCCDEYISHAWDSITPFSSIVTRYEKWVHPTEQLAAIPEEIRAQLDSPSILLAKGGGGSRLLSYLVEDCGIWLGNDINVSGDCMDMVIAVYQGVIEKYKCKADWQKELVVPQLRLSAARMLQAMPADKRANWGFKLPENLLLLPEINEAFPSARYIQMFRTPVKTCLRRTHMTARLDNQIGRVTLPLAYRKAGLPVEQILSDSPALHMAYTTLHQLGLSLEFCRKNFSDDRYIELYFEDILSDPGKVLQSFSQWLGTTPTGSKLLNEVDTGRAANPNTTYSPETESRINELLAPLLQEINYTK